MSELLSEETIEQRAKYLGHKLLKENRAGLSTIECRRELREFLTNMAAGRHTYIRVTQYFKSRWRK